MRFVCFDALRTCIMSTNVFGNVENEYFHPKSLLIWSFVFY